MIPSDMKLTDAYKTNEMNAQKAAKLENYMEEVAKQKSIANTKQVADQSRAHGQKEMAEAIARKLQEKHLQKNQPLVPEGLAGTQRPMSVKEMFDAGIISEQDYLNSFREPEVGNYQQPNRGY